MYDNPSVSSRTHLVKLNRVAEECGVVALLPLGISLLLGVLARRLVLTVTAGILAAQVDGHEDGQAESHELASQERAVAGVVLRAVLGEVEVGRDGTTEVAKADVHGDTNTALQGAADIVAIPGNTLRHVGVDARREEEATSILHTCRLRGHEHDQTDDPASLLASLLLFTSTGRLTPCT